MSNPIAYLTFLLLQLSSSRDVMRPIFFVRVLSTE